jgi:hypothetical protein
MWYHANPAARGDEKVPAKALPAELAKAIRDGDLNAICALLDAGGDPMAPGDLSGLTSIIPRGRAYFSVTQSRGGQTAFVLPMRRNLFSDAEAASPVRGVHNEHENKPFLPGDTGSRRVQKASFTPFARYSVRIPCSSFLLERRIR